MSAEFRVGRSVGRTIYQGDDLVGLMDTVELAERAVAAMNRAEALIDPNDRDNEWCEAITAEIPWEVDGDGDPMSSVADAVQSLRMQRDERIDPNDPAVAERILAIDGGGLFEQWEVDLILTALRSKP